MDHIRGMSSFSAVVKGGTTSLTKKGRKALALLDPGPNGPIMAIAHEDSENLRRFAERFRKRRPQFKDSVAKFDLDPESGQISVTLVDELTGEVQLRLSPEDVAQGLKELEETGDNEVPLENFFIDIKI